MCWTILPRKASPVLVESSLAHWAWHTAQARGEVLIISGASEASLSEANCTARLSAVLTRSSSSALKGQES